GDSSSPPSAGERWEFFFASAAVAARASTPPPRDGSSRRTRANEQSSAGRSSFFTATEGASGKPSSWSTAVKTILCVRLKNFPIDQLRRRLRLNSPSLEGEGRGEGEAREVYQRNYAVRLGTLHPLPQGRRNQTNSPRDMKVTSSGRAKLFM